MAYRHRDRIVVVWLLAATAVVWPPRGWAPSGILVCAGIALRLWARRHIGAHSRGRILSSPERSVSGPYRIFPHPLYLANLLVAGGLVSALTGPTWSAPLVLAGPACLYLFLAIQESRRLRSTNPPVKRSPPAWNGMRIGSEWASVLPPAVLWTALLLVAGR